MQAVQRILILVFVVLISSCSLNRVTPYNGGNEGLVIFKAQAVRHAGGELWYDYIYTIRNEENGATRRVHVYPGYGDEYEALGRFPPGEYTIVKRDSWYKNKVRYTRRESKGFTVEAGKISIPYTLYVRSGSSGQNGILYGLAKKDQQEFYLEKLQDHVKFKGWELYLP